MLAVFTSELESTQSELETLLAKVDALRGQMKSLKAAQNKALKVVDHLKNLVSELPELAIAELKKEILSLFPSDQAEAKESAPIIEVFTNFVTEVPETEVTTPETAKNEEVNDRWNPADFEPMEYQAENNGQLNLLQPTTTEPPEPDDYPDLASFEAAWTEWKMQQEGEAEEELAHVCAKDFFNAIDLSGTIWEELKAALKPVRQPKQSLIVKGEVTSVEEALDDDQWPEVEPTPKTTENNYTTTEYLNDTVTFIKKYDGEILAGYIATAKRELASDWAECLSLWGCRAEGRKAKRFGKGIRWEVKVTKISMEQLITVANHHPGLYCAVPKQSEQLNMKNLLKNRKRETNENLGDSKQLQNESPLPSENCGTTTEVKASVDADIILKGESAKADLFPQHFYQDERKCLPNDLIRVNQNCHHISVIGLTGKVVTSTPTGCIARFDEIGNRWLINSQFEVVKEQVLVS